MQTLNASLRLTHYLENNQTFPSHEDLLPHLEAEQDQHRLDLKALEEGGEVALGWRSEFLYRDRFNLAAADKDLVADGPAGPAAPAPIGGPFAVAWRNYMKSVFQKGFMYRLSCKPSVVLYIAENKTLSGKEDRMYQGEALGRKMAVVFFEDAEGGLVRRVNREGLAMEQQLLSLAELLQTIGGVELPADPERTAATTELLLESHYQHLELLRFTCTLEVAAPEVHVFSLEEQVNAEAAYALELPPDQRTKMVLARSLQQNHELNPEETLQGAWSLGLAELRLRGAHLFPAAPAPPAPAGRGRGARRGRGRGLS